MKSKQIICDILGLVLDMEMEMRLSRFVAAFNRGDFRAAEEVVGGLGDGPVVGRSTGPLGEWAKDSGPGLTLAASAELDAMDADRYVLSLSNARYGAALVLMGHSSVCVRSIVPCMAVHPPPPTPPTHM